MIIGLSGSGSSGGGGGGSGSLDEELDDSLEVSLDESLEVLSMLDELDEEDSGSLGGGTMLSVSLRYGPPIPVA